MLHIFTILQIPCSCDLGTCESNHEDVLNCEKKYAGAGLIWNRTSFYRDIVKHVVKAVRVTS